MAKRSSHVRNSEWIEEDTSISNLEVAEVIEYFEPEIETQEFVRLQLNKELLLTVVGEITGTVYKWNGSGSVIDVDKRDADKIIEKMRTYISCCGSFSTPKFSIV